MKRHFHQVSDDNSTTIEITAPEGSCRPAPRDLILETWLNHEPKTVSVQTGTQSANISLPHLTATTFANSPNGWTFMNNLLTVKNNDSFEPMQFTIQN